MTVSNYRSEPPNQSTNIGGQQGMAQLLEQFTKEVAGIKEVLEQK